MNAIEKPALAPEVLDQTNQKVFWKECLTCGSVLPFGKFRRDASYREGVRDQCLDCESAPRMSNAEHTARLREINMGCDFTQRQRWEHQEELYDDTARFGRPMLHGDFIAILKRLVPNLYVTEGNIVGDWALFKVYGSPQPQLGFKDYEYLFYLPSGILPEFSQYEFNDRDVPVREKRRGWRTVLLRLIKSGMLTEETVNRVFGKAIGVAAARYNRELWKHRNQLSA